MSGCNIVGPAAVLIAGPEKTEARYQLPADRSTVVFVDDRSSVLPNRSSRGEIAQAAERTLLDGGAVPKADVISSTDILAVTAGEKFGRPMGIAEVGQSVGAKVVVYATVDSFGLSPDGTQYQPQATARVKVVDAQTKGRLWPKEPEEWQSVSVSLPPRQGTAPRSVSERSAAERDLAERLGVVIGRVFIKHQTRDANPRIGS